jgi:hypothetical protein
MREQLEILADFLKDEFINELRGQDHVATGDLLDSIKYEIKRTTAGYEIVFEGLDYGKYLDTGTKAGRYVPINNLIKWVEVKGIASGEKEIKNAAYAIQQKIFQEGTPTSGSYKYSNNGRRTDWIQFVAENNTAKINSKLIEILSEEINTELFNLAKKISV